jgi:hypothetical protein
MIFCPVRSARPTCRAPGDDRPAHELPLAAQCRLLGVARGCAYYRPVPVSEADLRLMRRIDERHLAFVFSAAAGCR